MYLKRKSRKKKHKHSQPSPGSIERLALADVKRDHMKKLLLALPLVFMACESQGNSVNKLEGHTPDHINRLEIEKLSEEIHKGLYKITIDDTVNILIYRGVESCTMIQVK